MTHKIADNNDAASSMQEMHDDKPHGWVQWKGTNVCMDIHCSCGHHSHVDAEFAYYVICPACQRKWFMNGHIEMIEVKEIGGGVSPYAIKRPAMED